MKKQLLILLIIILVVLTVGAVYLFQSRPDHIKPLLKQESGHDSLEYFYQTSQQLSNQNTDNVNQNMLNKLNNPNTILK